MNRLDPKQLPNSKWTAVHPQDKEKHFLVIRCFRESGELRAEIEAVYSGRRQILDPDDLRDESRWLRGWQ